MAITVSAVLIVKDEEAVLEACLRSVAWADQVVVYDTGSSDRTLEIARELADVVVSGHWDDDFGAARNRSLEHATGDWVLTIDADEAFVGDPSQFRAALGADGATTHTIVQVNDRAVALGRGDDAAVMRVFRRPGYTWVGAVHEQLTARPGWPAPAAHPVRSAVLEHGGYRAGVMAAKDKATRNVTLARRDLAAAMAAGGDRAVTARFNLVRSLAMAGRTEEALELGDAMRRAGDLGDPLVDREVCQVMTEIGTEAGDERARRWWRRWERLAPERAWSHRAVRAAAEGDPQAVLDAIGRLPFTAPPGREHASAAEHAPLAVWALARLDRWPQAAALALRAARAGYLPGHPKDLVLVFRAIGRPLDELVGALSGEAWTSLSVLATQDGAPAVNELLEAMIEARPGDVTVLTCAGQRAGVLTIDEAMRWSARARAAGLVDLCPLRAIAAAEGLDPRQRALAGAVAVGGFDDGSVLEDIAAALALVPTEHEAELAGLIEAAAPGLLAPAGAPNG